MVAKIVMLFSMSGRRGRGGGSRPKFVTTGSGLLGKVAQNLAMGDHGGPNLIQPQIRPQAPAPVRHQVVPPADHLEFENIPDISMPGKRPAIQTAVPPQGEFKIVRFF
mgnify:CR=1 FL=1